MDIYEKEIENNQKHKSRIELAKNWRLSMSTYLPQSEENLRESDSDFRKLREMQAKVSVEEQRVETHDIMGKHIDTYKTINLPNEYSLPKIFYYIYEYFMDAN